LDLYNIYIKTAISYHPETNGKMENRNKEIGLYLRLLNEQEKEWDELLSAFELTVNIDMQLPEETREEYLLRKFIKHRKWN